MRIACISDLTYRACLPDDPNCLSWYGSEPYHSVLAKAFEDHGHEVHWFAPAGSSKIGVFHPMLYDFGQISIEASVENNCINRCTLDEIADLDFVIDMSANMRTIESLFFYKGYRNYLSYRNGYSAYGVPRLHPGDRNYVVPSEQNRAEFKKAGFPAMVAYYGIPEFYHSGSDPEYFSLFAEKYALKKRGYFLFPHRPTPDKGVDIVLQLAKKFPQENFVISSATPIYEHQSHLQRIRSEAMNAGLKNLIAVDMPLNPKHHYFKRELMRWSKAVLSPLGRNYLEGFGLSNAEAVACGVPLIISDSPSTRELWMDSDALVVEGESGFANAVRMFDMYSFQPKNRYTVEKYYQRYMELISLVMSGEYLKVALGQPTIAKPMA